MRSSSGWSNEKSSHVPTCHRPAHPGARRLLRADTYTGTNGYTGADGHTGATDCDAYADKDAHGHAYSYTGADGNRNTNADSHAEADTDAHARLSGDARNANESVGAHMLTCLVSRLLAWILA